MRKLFAAFVAIIALLAFAIPAMALDQVALSSDNAVPANVLTVEARAAPQPVAILFDYRNVVQSSSPGARVRNFRSTSSDNTMMDYMESNICGAAPLRHDKRPA